MTNRCAKISFWISLSVVGCSILLWCLELVVVAIWDFGPMITKVTPAGIRVTMWVETNNRPFSGFPIGVTSHRPYDLLVAFSPITPDVSVRTAVVERLVVRYDKGRQVPLVSSEAKMVWRFAKRRSSNWEGGRIVYHESLGAGGLVPNCIDENRALVVDMKGVIIDAGGKKKPFVARVKFCPRLRIGLAPRIYFTIPKDVRARFPTP